ncbi:MAG: 1-deoxy-D-xylulose-5-phosphate reductoisomerase [Planctomycetota bacterium]
MKSLALFGSTGSIGTQTLDVVRAHPNRLSIAALAAHGSWEAVAEQAREFRPAVVAIADPVAGERLREVLPSSVALRVGPDALCELAAEADYDLAVHGVVGAAGVETSFEVVERAKDLALANKESLVVAGELLMERVRTRGSALIPIDSEHAAIHQCLRGERRADLRKLIVTASGGPFRDRDRATFDSITPTEALAHPNWDMGPRISIGSATLMNKALEIIEAGHLFGVGPHEVEVVVHRESIVHSLVEFVDGSVVAQMGPPDMRFPIHYALFAPERVEASLQGFDARRFGTLHFEELEPERFPALALGYRALAAGGAAGCILNAADEVAVAAFLAGDLAFTDIARLNAAALDGVSAGDLTLAGLLETDRRTRAWSCAWIEAHAKQPL